MFKKIIFPFFNKSKHGFLIKKARFRFLISLYIVILFFIPTRAAYKEYSTAGDLCYYSIFESEVKVYDKYSDCMKAYGYYGGGTTLFYFGINLLLMIIIHYAFQLIFFKWFINYIILGGKKE